MSFYQPVQAGVYRWVDASGQVHFGERPPQDIESEVVNPPPPPALPADQGALLRGKIQQQQADYTRNRHESKAAATEAKATAKTRQKNCLQSRKAIASINKYMNKRMFDEAGNYVEESGRQKKLADARQSAAHWCD